MNAVAICRVFTPEQRLNNSLNRQEESVQKAAKTLGVEIIKTWSGKAKKTLTNYLDGTVIDEEYLEQFSRVLKNP